MNLKISGNKIGNPLLLEILEALTICFEQMNQTFFVIGATARDLILHQLPNASHLRRTRDLDIAIAIPDWQAFDRISETLCCNGFEKDSFQHQRFYFKDYELDIVPFGNLAKEDDNIYWPPEETTAMSVKGFSEVLQDAVNVTVDRRFSFKIASLPGLFLLKFNAWQDRHMSTSKDAEDMSSILSNYFEANIERNIHPEVYELKNFDVYIAGAYWLAYDLGSLLEIRQLVYYTNCIKAELDKKEAGLLINQIVENNAGLSYETVHDAWQTIANVFQKLTTDAEHNN